MPQSPTRGLVTGPASFPPAPRWTRYGKWTEDGLQVLGSYGQVVYTLPGVARIAQDARHAPR